MTKYAHWAEKIDSYDKFNEAYQKGRPSYQHEMHLSHPSGNSYPTQDYWFVLREAYREAAGIYPEPTSVLTSLRNSYAGLAQYFVHVSKDDPTMVAYTPDRTAGLADKQVRTTLGRFLRKYLLCPSDDWVAKQEAQHRSDLNGEFLEAKTVEEIEEVYTKMRGDSGCMRHRKQDFKLDYHPSAVYAAPGLSVAYLRNASGEINARTVIYVNPQKPDDKRFVRIYGDQALASKLKRQGFRQAALEGARLGMYPAGKGKNKNCYVMPYLDGPGGNRGSGKDCEAEYVVWPKGEDYFVPISNQTATMLSNAGLPYYGARNTSGYIEVEPTDLSSMNVTCHFTGKTANLLAGDAATRVILEDGTQVYASEGEHLLPFTASLRIYSGNNFVILRCTSETYAKFSFNGGYYPDEKTVSYFGFRFLSETFYPDLKISERVVEKNAALQVCVGDKYHWAKAIDVYTQIKTDGNMQQGFDHSRVRIFKTEVPALKKAGWVSVATSGSVKAIAHKDNPSLVKLNTGKLACINLHEISPLVEGGWAFHKNVKAANILGVVLFTLEDVFSVPMPVDEFKKWSFFKYDLRDPAMVDSVKQRLAMHIMRNPTTGCRPFVQPLNSTVRVANSYTENNYDNLVRAANSILGMSDADLLGVVSYSPSAGRLWARAVVAVDQILQGLIQDAKYADAEANAVDYSLTPTEVLEQAARDIRNHPKPAPSPVNGKVTADELLKWARTAGSGTGSVISSTTILRTVTPTY